MEIVDERVETEPPPSHLPEEGWWAEPPADPNWMCGESNKLMG